MRVLSTLYVLEHQAKVSVQRGNVLVRSPERSQRVPVETLDCILLLGGAQITSQALGLCVQRGIRVAAISRGGRLRFSVGGAVSGNVLLRVAQVQAATDPSSMVHIAQSIVAGKLRNCRRNMARWAWEAHEPWRSVIQREIEAVDERISRVRQVGDGHTIRGIEGDGTRRYFKCLGIHLDGAGIGMPFVVRSRRPPRDEVNALLSYLYGVVLAEVVGAIEAVGLDPQVGFLHGLRPGRPSLGLDLLEELRPAFADRLAVALLARRVVRLEHFASTAGRACYLTDAGRRTVIEAYDRFKAGTYRHRLVDRDVPRWALPSLQATLLARHLRGDLPAYAPFVMVA